MKTILFGFLAILGTSFTSATSYAQSCGQILHNPVVHKSVVHHTPVVSKSIIHNPVVSYNNHHVNKVVVKKEVVVPVAVPVLVPAFQFQYEPPNCCVPPASFQGAYPPQAQAPQGYQQQRPQQPVAPNHHNLSKNQLRDLAKLLLQEMDNQVKGKGQIGNNGGDFPPIAIDPYAPQQPANPTPPVNGGGGGNLPIGIEPSANSMTPQQAAPIALAALKQNCASCHTGVGSRGDMILFSNPGVFNANAPWRSIKREIESGRMPPRRSQFRLTEVQREAVITWLSKF